MRLNINLLDGRRTSEQVAAEIIKFHDISHEISVTHVLQDVLDLCVELRQSRGAEIQHDLQESVDMTTAVATNFLLKTRNVVLREEDPDEGALLFILILIK